MVGFGAWILCGLFLDSWAHLHLASALETLFTPWHFVFYGGYLACAAFLLMIAWRNHARGHAWRDALPPGYELCLAGVAIFAFGAILDVFWHLRFGIEKSFEALYSPTHMIVWVGMGLIIAGPLRAAWRRPGSPVQSVRAQLPALVSMALLFALTAAFSQHFNPFYIPWASQPTRPATQLPPNIVEQWNYLIYALGLSSVVVQTAILMGFLLAALRRGLLPVGAISLILGIDMLLFNASMLPAALAGGIAGDMLLAWLHPTPERVGRFRLFAFCTPLALYVFYYAEVALARGGIWWPVHLWVGSIGLAGITGIMVSFLVVPPARDRDVPDQASAIASTVSERSYR